MNVLYTYYTINNPKCFYDYVQSNVFSININYYYLRDEKILINFYKHHMGDSIASKKL